MIEAVMEPYLKNTLAASQWQVGSVFGLYGTVYTMASLLSGLVSAGFYQTTKSCIDIEFFFRFWTDSLNQSWLWCQFLPISVWQ